VVTSDTRFIARKKLEHVRLPVPRRLVAAEDVENGKPDPEAYLKGAEALGARPEACVVVEDAPSGIRSAKAAGMRVIAVATTYRREDLTGGRGGRFPRRDPGRAPLQARNLVPTALRAARGGLARQHGDHEHVRDNAGDERPDGPGGLHVCAHACTRIAALLMWRPE
jgi:beta-phosphoglucomutase-like phosphatase (HAD superfamily)